MTKRRSLIKKKSLVDKKVNDAPNDRQMLEKVSFYLESWKKQKEGDELDEPWKFKKARQVWLIRYLFEPEKVNKRIFKLSIDYFKDAPSGIRQRLVSKANEYITLGEPQKIEDSEPENTDKTDNEEYVQKRRFVNRSRKQYKRSLIVAENLS